MCIGSGSGKKKKIDASNQGNPSPPEGVGQSARESIKKKGYPKEPKDKRAHQTNTLVRTRTETITNSFQKEIASGKNDKRGLWN